MKIYTSWLCHEDHIWISQKEVKTAHNLYYLQPLWTYSFWSNLYFPVSFHALCYTSFQLGNGSVEENDSEIKIFLTAAITIKKKQLKLKTSSWNKLVYQLWKASHLHMMLVIMIMFFLKHRIRNCGAICSLVCF